MSKTLKPISRDATDEFLRLLESADGSACDADASISELPGEMQYLLDGYEWNEDLKEVGFSLMHEAELIASDASCAMSRCQALWSDIAKLRERLPDAAAALDAYDEEELLRAFLRKRENREAETKKEK